MYIYCSCGQKIAYKENLYILPFRRGTSVSIHCYKKIILKIRCKKCGKVHSFELIPIDN